MRLSAKRVVLLLAAFVLLATSTLLISEVATPSAGAASNVTIQKNTQCVAGPSYANTWRESGGFRYPPKSNPVDIQFTNASLDSGYTTYDLRFKPGSKTLQVYIQGYNAKTYQYFATSNNVSMSRSVMRVSGASAYNLTIDQAASLYQGNATIWEGNEVRRAGFQAASDNRGGELKWGKEPADQLRRKLTTGVEGNFQGTPEHAMYWRYGTWDDSTRWVFYTEVDVDAARSGETFIQLWFGQIGSNGGTTDYKTPIIKAKFVPHDSPNVDFYGFYDQPYLDPAVYSTDANNLLPKGLTISGSFWNYANGTRVALKEQRGSDCYTYTDGAVDFSASDSGGKDPLLQVWDNMAQRNGRRFYFVNQTDIDAMWTTSGDFPNGMISFEPDVWADPDFQKPADRKYHNNLESDRMRVGYLKGRFNGKQIPVKVMYYLESANWGVGNGDNGRYFRYHLRPYVLSAPDPQFPANPVAVSPYRNLVKWISFKDANQINDELRAGETIERPVIPGFLTVKCSVNAFTNKGSDDKDGELKDRPMDAWSPGFYYADGAPWLIGDEQKIGVHQTGWTNQTTASLTCWAERNDPGLGSEATKFPIGAFVALDGESTDGGYPADKPHEPYEFLAMANTDGKDVYPIASYSSCNQVAKDNLRAIGLSKWDQIKTAPGHTYAWTSPNINGSTYTGMKFYNNEGRCGELNGIRPSLADNDSSMARWGSLFGPALMAVAPVDPETYKNNQSQYTKDVIVSMQGRGKQSLGFGVILAGDTSNADYDRYMPAVYQLNSLSFNGSNKDLTGTTDWTKPAEYNKNFFYYGARLGRRAAPYDPNNKANLKLRDGAKNDSQPHDSVTFAGRTQPKIKPIDESSKADGAAYTTDLASKWFVGRDAQTIEGLTTSIPQNGVVLKSFARNTKKLTLTVPCGMAYKTSSSLNTTGTTIRGWADFNGNGMFDPDEASSVATCDPQNGSTKPLVASGLATNDLPWTDTTPVTLTFDYPATHEMNGKRNVWMRLRAVDTSDAAALTSASANERKLAPLYADTVREVNIDGGVLRSDGTTTPATSSTASMRAARAAAATGSAYGSWTYTGSGETEDYLFDITPGAKGQDDLMCVSHDKTSMTVAVLGNDTQEDGRKPKVDSVYFLKSQAAGVVISNGSRTATVPGEGVYTIDASTGAITFAPSEQMRTRMASLTSSSTPITLTPVNYAFMTEDGNTYDRSVAADAVLRGNIQYACDPQIQASLQADRQGGYQWNLNKTVLAGNEKTVLAGNERSSYVKDDSRQLGEHTTDEKVGLTYQLTVSAKDAGVTVSAIRGKVSILNPTGSAITTATNNPVELKVEGPKSTGLTCTLDDPASLAERQIQGGALTESFGFICSGPNPLPADGVTVTPILHLNTSAATSSIAATSFENGAATASNERVRLTDVLTGQGITDKLDLKDVPATVGTATNQQAISSIVLDGPSIVAAGSNGTGTTTVNFVVPQDMAPNYTGQTQKLTNTATLCDADTTDSCTSVPKIPESGDPTDPTVPPSEATVTITPSSVKIYILKTGLATNGTKTEVPLAGSTFEIYNDDAGKLTTRVTGEPKAVTGADPTGKSAQFIFEQPQVDKTYWLVETKAPAGHELLAQPVQFTVNSNGTVTLGDGKSDFVTTTQGQGYALITVRDVESGHLPAFGGPGVYMAFLSGLFLLGIAYLVRRSRHTSTN